MRKKRGERIKGIGFEQVPGRNRKTGEKQEHGRKDSVLRKVSGGKPSDSGTWKGTRSKGIGFEEGTYQPECSLGTCFWIGHYPSNEGWRSLWKSMSFLGVFGIWLKERVD